ncbi:helix-turn-helix transcriptional regulator [Lactobacillus gasseri]|nr:helix-turn-helix transcriptional regulator [Lactobacillus gasseri]MCZ3762267.1 helix-turn-helix transcriptional regulator [Lactobacillus gasseri]MCZ3765748.1 helix-turn-helix transcriptional regulator [Lactobacillus gasseri]MCZ3767463.1 helix-turn-helix transcriptional regulator [Lactobacillus gasseri]MCZ3771020.1 helix-turn-helix transcriptional regulator [Lactobacillus gasseri]
MNRIKELRLNKNISQSELGKKVNASNQAISAYESGFRTPKKETWQALADFFGVSVPYLQGAYSKQEILKILQEYYLRYFMGNYSIDIENMIYMDIGNVVDDFVISKKIKPWNIKKEDVLLSKEEVNSTKFWWEHFQVVFDHIAIIWLLTKPSLNATKRDVADALLDALSGEQNNMLLTRRMNFLDKYLYFMKGKTIKTIYDFEHPHSLDGKNHYIDEIH